MGRAPSTRIKVVAIAALVAAIGLGGWVFRRSQSTTEPAVQSNPLAIRPPATGASSDSGFEGGAPRAKPPSLNDLPRPALTAGWMTTPANPLIVEMTAGQRDEEQKITPGGGELELTLDTGDHVTLRVPAGAVTRNAEFRLASVTTISGWPHAPGTVISVLVSAEPGVLLRGASLTFERRSRRDRTPLPAMAGFAVDRENRQLHLYAYKRESGDENGERFTMPVTRFGAYGIVEADRPDVEVMHARIPTDLLSRLEADLAVGLLQQAQMAGSASLRADVVRASLQSAAGFPAFVPEWVARIIAQLRDYYEQVLLSWATNIQPSCGEDAVTLFMLLHAQVSAWQSVVEQVVQSTEGPSEGSAVSAEADQYWRAIRAEFDQKTRALGSRLEDLMKQLFAAVETCCRNRPQYWMPGSMAVILRYADSNGLGETVLGLDRWEKVDTCKCAANILNGIEGWRGTITHTETFEPSPKVTTSKNRTETNSVKQTYEATINLTREREGSHVGFVRARGTRDTGWDFEQNATGRCASSWKRHTATSLTGKYDDEEVVNLAVHGDGTYTIAYPTPPAEGVEWVEDTSVFSGGCTEWTIRQNTWDKPHKRYGGVSGSEVGHLGGKVNEADRSHLKETVERSLPWEFAGVPGTLYARISWDLTRCVATR